MREDTYEFTYRIEDTYWWYVGRRRIVMSWIRRLLAARAGEPVRLLDYGCGTGAGLAALAAFGTACGIDTSEQAIAFCRRRGLENTALIEEGRAARAADIFGGRFDLVVMLDVLEHIRDDTAALEEAGTLLSPGGAVVLTVPALPFLWSGEDEVSHHVRRYTAQSLRQVLTRAGFDVVRLSHFNALLLPLQIAVVLGRRLFRTRTRGATLVRPVPRSLNALLTGVLSLEERLLRRLDLPWGASLICTARRGGREA